MDFIWTNHARDRLKDRKITIEFANQTLSNPDNTFEENGALKYKKRFANQTATAIVKKNELGENIVLSFWVDPPNAGTKDFRSFSRKKESVNAGPIKKLFLTLLNQIGL